MTPPPAARGEAGVTLVELAVVVALLAVVVAMFSSTLLSTQSTVNTAAARSVATASARTALGQIDREVRSGNAVYDPALENDAANGLAPGMALRLYTQNTTSATSRCVHWRVVGSNLQQRSWSPDWRTSGNSTKWMTVATDVTNATSSPTVPAFSLASQGSYGGRVVNVSLVIGSTDPRSVPTYTNLSIEARNAAFRYSSVCADAPPAT